MRKPVPALYLHAMGRLGVTARGTRVLLRRADGGVVGIAVSRSQLAAVRTEVGIEQEDGRSGGFEDCSSVVIGACVEVHRVLGPGLLESAHEACLAHEAQLISYLRLTAGENTCIKRCSSDVDCGSSGVLRCEESLCRPKSIWQHRRCCAAVPPPE